MGNRSLSRSFSRRIEENLSKLTDCKNGNIVQHQYSTALNIEFISGRASERWREKKINIQGEQTEHIEKLDAWNARELILCFLFEPFRPQALLIIRCVFMQSCFALQFKCYYHLIHWHLSDGRNNNNSILFFLFLHRETRMPKTVLTNRCCWE